MKGLLFFDIYHSIFSFVNPHIQSKLTSLNKKIHSLIKSYQNDFVQQSSYFGLLIPALFFIKSKIGATHFTMALANASQGSHKDLCSFIKISATEFNLALAKASEGGYLDICSFSYFIMLGATDFNWALINAAKGGHKDLCKYLIKIGATNFKWALEEAARGGHLDLCKYLIKNGATDFNWAIKYAKDEKTREFLRNERAAFL